ncbi:hypothetical protein ACFQJ5_07435 [Halomicroarcula sp. GCM10025324]|uniref:DUF7286 family protein n=1 Tax=Haloarcula TaxID=2237 RepID=UPI0023E8BAB8|nr:hypothetical protein [Halomicroarcula sp. ZS-22-S1]
MRADTRGRVPFALLGVLLLVSSLSLAPTLVPTTAPTETAVERVLDRTTAETQTAIRDGAATAAHRAATDPVITPANTTVGRSLNESAPFRDALRLRVYLQVRKRLTEVSETSEGVTATASLPAVTDANDVDRAIDRVRVERGGPNRTAMRATVENVTLTVRRGNRTVTTRTLSPTVVVTAPALLLHDRVTAYEQRLNNGLGKPGLSQRLTARLYPIAWARGYAQFGGAPIENVVANRHVALAANGAALGVQRSTFGRSDPDGRRALTEATAVTGVEDVVRGSDGGAFAGRVLDQADYRPAAADISTVEQRSDYPRPGDAIRIGVNETATRAFREVAAPTQLNRTLRAAYSVEVRLTTTSERLRGGPPGQPQSPGPDWTLVDGDTTRQTTVAGGASADAPARDGWHTLDTYGRIVVREYTRTALWKNDNETRTTVATSTERWRVSVAVLGRHEGGSSAPTRGIRTAHERGAGPLSGPNLADIEPRAERHLIRKAGGRNAVAQRALRGEVDTEPVTVRGARPAGLRRWVYRDVAALRERLQSISVAVERESVGAFERNPARKLRTRVADRRQELAAVPATYGSTAEKARVAARIAYLDAVERRLDERVRRRTGARDRFADVLQGRTEGSLTDLRRGLTAREARKPPSRPAPTGPAGPVRFHVDASPQYLTRAALGEANYPAMNGSEHPLAVRNVNVFTVPYGDAAATVTDGLSPSDGHVRLATAAATLSSANRTASVAANGTVTNRRDRLRRAVAKSNDEVARAMAATVSETTGVDTKRSRAIVAASMRDWNSTASRALALSNGSASTRVAAVAATRLDLSKVERDWLEVRLRAMVADRLEEPGARPRASLVNRTAAAVRSVAHEEATRALGDAGRKRVEQLVARRTGTSRLPAGIPLAPPLSPWYATANVWWVTVEGEYARFEVSARHGSPTVADASTSYVRDGEPVHLDVDSDGAAERLGTSDRVTFRAETGVVVVVPPRPRGVGDKDGEAVETSAGWPDAGT